MRMSFFTRRALAKQLGVSDSRISQMQSSGELAAPDTFVDDTVAGWPASYVESFSGKRQGHQVSPSIYGLLPPSSPLPRIENLIVHLGDLDVHVQVFQAKAFPIALVTPLSQAAQATWPEIAPRAAIARSLDIDLAERLRPDTPLGKALRAVAGQLFNDDLFTCAWLVLDSRRHFTERAITELVISDENTQPPTNQFAHHLDYRTLPEPRIKTSELAFQTVAEKLGRPVPMFPSFVNTRAVVEDWLAEGGDKPVRVVIDADGMEEAAAAAVILHRLPKLTVADRAVLCSALMRRIDWEESNEDIPVYFPPLRDQAAIDFAAVQVAPDLKGKYERYLAEIGEEELPVADAQAVVDRATDLIYHVYGEYGEFPEQSVANALETGIDAVHSRVRRDSGYMSELHRTQYHTVRTFRPDLNPEWHTYSDSLERGGAPATPAERELSRRTEWGQGEGSPQLFHDGAGVPATSVRVRNLRDEHSDHELVSVAVPVVTSDVPPARYADFDSIVIAANTQEGPVLLKMPDGYGVMPFTSASPGRFTYGYSGHGPGNLIQAVEGFVEWATGLSFTQVGYERLRAAVIGSYQEETLVITRSYLTQPGSLEARAFPDERPQATDRQA